MKNRKARVSWLLIIASIFLLSSCGGASSKTSLPADVPPLAQAEIVGVGSQAKVRSGSDVLLSGQNSKGFDDPILNYQWTQIDSSGFKVELYERTKNSVAFTAPDVPIGAATSLKFRLTVTDADGVSAQSEVELLVQSVKDANHFLATPSAENKVIAYVSAGSGEMLISHINVSLLVSAVATWRGRDGNQHQATIMEKMFTGEILAGKVGLFNGSGNPAFTIDLPELNADQINKNFKAESRLARLEFENLQDASIALNFQLQNDSSAPLSVYLTGPSNENLLELSSIKQKNQSDNSASFNKPIIAPGITSASIDVDELRQALKLESKLSVHNYYKCIDPEEKAITFSGWAANAGFSGKDDGDINTKYINNYDLGFGRDMHIRKDDKGNVYSYVTNFVSLENVLSNRNEFAIVAMEYSPAPKGNCGDAPDPLQPVSDHKIVKFYTFIPDQKNGGYRRSESINFDGRGEKYIPGVCTSCHYGNNHTEEFTSTGKIPTSFADLNSSFMPWDLDALLYTQAKNSTFIDPTYASYAKATSTSDVEKNHYSREAQEAAFKNQNQIVLHTFTENAENIPRFTHAITQLHGWYGGVIDREKLEALNFGGDARVLSASELQQLQAQLKTLPSGSFDGSYIPKGWRGNKSQEALYTDVYERNCRMCHLFTPNIKFDFDSYDEFVGHPHLKNYVFERGLMPLSRLTMDRFWLDFNGGQSAAEKLRLHLNINATPENDIAVDAVPGKTVAIILPAATPNIDADIVLDFDEDILLDATSSVFSKEYRWLGDGVTLGAASQLLFKAGKPGSRTQLVLEVTGNNNQLSQALRRIKIRNYKVRAAQFTVSSIKEGGSALVNIFTLLCPEDNIDSKTCRALAGNIKKGEVPAIQLDQNVINGEVNIIDPIRGVMEFKSTRTFQMGAGIFTFTLKDSFGEVSESISIVLPVEGYPAPIIASSHKCTVAALSVNNDNCENPALSDVPAEGLQLELFSVDAVSEHGGSVSYSSGVLRYTPPPFFVGADSFKYSVKDNSLSGVSAQGKVDVTVVAENIYSNVQAKVPSPLAAINEGEQVTVNLFEALCPNSAADSVACRSVFGAIKQGEYPQLQLSNNAVNGVATIVDGKKGLVKFISKATRLAGNGEFNFTLTDSFGQSTGNLTAIVKINSLPAPSIGGPDTCNVSAKTTVNSSLFPIGFGSSVCPDPATNDIAATGLMITLDSVDQISAKGGSVSLNNGVIFYTPPANYVGVDSFNYRIRDNSFSQKVSQGVVTITVSATVTFASISESINSSCPTCHRTNTTTFGPNWRQYSVFSAHAGGLGSAFMAYACGDPNHLGENRLCKSSLDGASPTSADQLNSFGQTILTWVEEGALNN